jgi:Zn finger protein HypA/HybF involved in hydrogenase expression
MAQDTYKPAAPGVAVCPHCSAPVEGAPTAPTATLHLMVLHWTCPRCGGRWNEVREGEVVERFYACASAAPEVA